MKEKKFGSRLYLPIVAVLIAASRFSASAVVMGDELNIGIGETLTTGVYSGIGGGGGNTVLSSQSLIGCGTNNRILTASPLNFIGGGANNTVSSNSAFNFIGGGTDNFVGTNSPNNFIGGGTFNYVARYSPLNVVVGGSNNVVDTNASYNFIGGGANNYVSSNAPYNFIGGGFWNESDDTAGFIGGGEGNFLDAEAAVIGGGQTNVNYGYYAAIVGGTYNSIPSSATGNGDFIGAGTYNTNYGGWASIVGGSLNMIKNPSVFAAFIGGGLNNTIGLHSSAGLGAAIVGGYYNTNLGQYSFTGGGQQNYVQAVYGVIDGGNSNSIYGTSFGANAGSAIGGGSLNTISGADAASIGGGLGNFAAAQGATIPGGQYASATNYGQQAYASGAFAAGGDAQTSTYVVRNTTTTNSLTELFLDGSSAQMALPDNTSWTFDILVVGRSSTGGNTGSYQILGSIEKTSGTTSIVGSVTVNTLAESVAAWDATAQADNSTGALVVKVTGDSTTVRWVATVRTVEVTN